MLLSSLYLGQRRPICLQWRQHKGLKITCLPGGRWLQLWGTSFVCLECEEFGRESWAAAVLGDPCVSVGHNRASCHSWPWWATASVTLPGPPGLSPLRGWRGGTSHVLKPGTSLIAFPKQPLKQGCSESSRRLRLENGHPKSPVSPKSPFGMEALSEPFHGLFLCLARSSVPKRWSFPWGQGPSSKFLHNTQALSSLTVTSWAAPHFSALLMHTWLSDNHTRISVGPGKKSDQPGDKIPLPTFIFQCRHFRLIC